MEKTLETDWTDPEILWVLNEIRDILQVDFPGRKITGIRLTERNNGIVSMECYINGESFYMSFLPEYSRKQIFDLLNY